MGIFFLLFLPLVLTVGVVLLTARSLGTQKRGSSAGHTRVADLHREHYPYALTLTVSGMDTEAAARRLQDSLNALEGTWAEKADWQGGTVHLLCKEKPDTAALRSAAAAAGCTVLSTRREA
jgi:hypothetical protein